MGRAGGYPRALRGGDMAVEVVQSSKASAVLGNQVTYVPLVKAGLDTIQFQVPVPPAAGALKIRVHYYMSAAHGGDVELRLDRLAVAPGGDPTAALTLGTEFVVTPGNDALLHVVDESSHASFTIAVTGGGLLACKLYRTNDAQDTHTGDMRVLSISAGV